MTKLIVLLLVSLTMLTSGFAELRLIKTDKVSCVVNTELIVAIEPYYEYTIKSNVLYRAHYIQKTVDEEYVKEHMGMYNANLIGSRIHLKSQEPQPPMQVSVAGAGLIFGGDVNNAPPKRNNIIILLGVSPEEIMKCLNPKS